MSEEYTLKLYIWPLGSCDENGTKIPNQNEMKYTLKASWLKRFKICLQCSSHWRDMGSIKVWKEPLEDNKSSPLQNSFLEVPWTVEAVVCCNLGCTKLDKTETAKHTHICSKRLILNKKIIATPWGLKYKLQYSDMWIIQWSENCHYFLFPGSRLHPMEPSNNTQISEFLHLGISSQLQPSYLGFSSPYTWSLCLGKLIIIFTVSSNSHIHTPMTFSPTCPL